jgi:hypothetical protein
MIPMRRWLAASSFSLFTLALVLAYDAYRGMRGRAQLAMEVAAAVVCAAVGFIGVWVRHRDEH